MPDPKIVANVDYGPFPENYQELVKAYLQTQPTISPLDLSTARFLNTPNEFIYTQLGRADKYGYRVCVLVSTVDSRDTRSNFLLINNDQVIKHLHDSGLIRLSDDFCDVQMLALDSKASGAVTEVVPAAVVVAPDAAVVAPEVVVLAPVATVDTHGFKYIVCSANGEERFFAFNAEKHQLLEERAGRVVITLALEQLSDTFIVATGNDNARIAINRISGTMLYQHAGSESEGSCELTSRQMF